MSTPAADTVGFHVPDGFVDLPHLHDPETLAEKLRDVVDIIGAEAAPEQRENLLSLYRTAYAQLLREGAIYIGYGYFRKDDGGLSICTFNAFLKDHPETNPYLIVRQATTQHSEGGSAHAPGTAVTPLQLACGPAAFILRMSLAPADLPAAAAAVWQAQAVIPFPQGRKVLVLDLSTPCTDEAPYYAGILDGIARTVTFTTTEPAPTPEPARSVPRSRIADALG
jgi:hypothetical protein